MTVSELIAELQKMPPEKPVKLSNFSDGDGYCRYSADIWRVSFEGSHVAIEEA